MSFKLTARTRSILNQIEKNPSILFEVEGVDLILSSSVVFELITWDKDGIEWDQEGVTWDGSIASDDFKSYINLSESTRSIMQQIYPDKEGASSISSMMLTILDKNSEVSRAFALNTIGEILGKKCTLYFGFVGANYPQDFMPIMNSIITDYSYKSGTVKMTLTHSDTLRNQSILTEYNSQLTAGITDVATVIPVSTTSKLLPSVDVLTSYVKIDDEIMLVNSIDSGIQLTVTRGALGTTAEAHDNESEVKSVYNLTDFPLTLAQKIMQSSSDNAYFESDIELLSFQFVSVTESIDNAIIFNDYNIERSTGLISGDILEIDTYGVYTVSTFGTLANGNSYIIVNEDLSDVVNVGEAWRFKSQYNVLNFGLGMQPFEVDNQQFEDIKGTFSPNFTEMSFTLNEGIGNARDFINKELYFVSGCYGIPRNARSSVKFLSPPLSIENLPILNETNILNMIDLNPERSINKFYYNDILFAFNKSIIDGDFKSFSQFIDIDSVNQFNVGNKQLRIESEGFERSTEVDLILDRLADRFLDRYKEAAIFIKSVKLPFKTGFNIQVGDVVLFGGDSTQLVNYDTGDRKLPLDKYEVINQTINISGEVVVDLLSTGYAIQGTFGVFSPSSTVLNGSTTTKLILGEINNLDEETFERDKWNLLIGSSVRVRTQDYSFDETVTFVSLDQQSNTSINITALSMTPPANSIVELALYDDFEDYGTDEISDYVKIKYTFTMNSSLITAVTDESNFEVIDVSKFFIGQLISVRSEDFTRDNFESTISNIVGDLITLSSPLDFTPVIGDRVDSRSFADLDGYLFL